MFLAIQKYEADLGHTLMMLGVLYLWLTQLTSWDRRQLWLSKLLQFRNIYFSLYTYAESDQCLPPLYRQLLEILVHPTVRKRRIPVLLACNKSDEGAKAHTVEFVRKRLEREM